STSKCVPSYASVLNRISEQNSSRSCPVAFRTDNHLGDYRKPGGNQGLGLVVPTRGDPNPISLQKASAKKIGIRIRFKAKARPAGMNRPRTAGGLFSFEARE